MTRRSSAVERCEQQLKEMGISDKYVDPPNENEERILDCFGKLARSLTISELYELGCLLYYLRKYWEGIGT